MSEFERARTAINTVFGAALGGYFGVTLGEADDIQLVKFSLALVLIAAIVLFILDSGHEFHTGEIGPAIIRVVLAGGLIAALDISYVNFGYEPEVLAILLGGWMSTTVIWSSLASRSSEGQKND